MSKLLLNPITPFLLLALFAIVVWLPLGIWGLTKGGLEALSGTYLLLQTGLIVVSAVVDRLLVKVVDFRWLVVGEILVIGIFFLGRLWQNRQLRVRSAESLEYFVLIGDSCPPEGRSLQRRGIFNRQISIDQDEALVLISAEALRNYRINTESLNWAQTYMSGIRDTMAGREYSIDIYRAAEFMDKGQEAELLRKSKRLLQDNSCR